MEIQPYLLVSVFHVKPKEKHISLWYHCIDIFGREGRWQEHESSLTGNRLLTFHPYAGRRVRWGGEGERINRKERQSIKPQSSLWVTYFFQQASTSYRFHNVPKQHSHLWTKHANTWVPTPQLGAFLTKQLLIFNSFRSFRHLSNYCDHVLSLEESEI